MRPAPKRYKNFRARNELVPIKNILKEPHEKHENEVALPLKETALALCLLPTTQPGENATGWIKRQSASVALEKSEELQRVRGRWTNDSAEIKPVVLISEKEGPRYSRFEAWVEGKGQECLAPIPQVICKYRDTFMDTLPPGLP